MGEPETIITPGMSAETAFLAVIAACAEAIGQHLSEVMASDDPAGPHKARVALRRLRTALDTFAPLLGPAAVRALRHEARDIFHLLGAVRDADVYLATRGKTKGTKGARALAREAAQRRADTRAELDRRGARHFPERLRAWSAQADLFRSDEAGVAARRAPVAELAGEALERAFADLRARGKRLSRMDDKARHGFRKALKTLRYQGEFFAPLWPGPEADQARAAVAALQDDLGLLNDMANARRREGRHSPPVAAERQALKAADAAWKSLRKAPGWWLAAPVGPA